MAAHMLGMAEMAASIRENVRQQRKATRAGGVYIDALTQLQVDERADWTPERITARFAARGSELPGPNILSTAVVSLEEHIGAAG